MKGLFNYTPHSINLNNTLNLESCGALRLFSEQESTNDTIMGIPIALPPIYTKLLNEEIIDKTHLLIGIIVSMPVGIFLKDNPDVLSECKNVYGPDTGPGYAIRNEKGQIIGAKRLIKYR